MTNKINAYNALKESRKSMIDALKVMMNKDYSDSYCFKLAKGDLRKDGMVRPDVSLIEAKHGSDGITQSRAIHSYICWALNSMEIRKMIIEKIIKELNQEIEGSRIIAQKEIQEIMEVK